MHAVLYALLYRRRSLALAALLSGGAHAMLLFGFPGGHLVGPPVTLQEESEGGIPPPEFKDPPPPPPAGEKSTEAEPSNSATSPVRATLAEPPSRLEPGKVVADIPFEPGVMPNPAFPTSGIPSGQEIIGRHGPTREIVNFDDLEKKPEPVAQVAPSYPFDAKNQHLEGVVVVRFIVTAAGAVESATIGSTTHPVFNEPALAAVRKWRFKAGIKNGANVATRMEIPLAFHLKD